MRDLMPDQKDQRPTQTVRASPIVAHQFLSGLHLSDWVMEPAQTGRRYVLFVLEAGSGRIIRGQSTPTPVTPSVLWFAQSEPMTLRLDAGSRGWWLNCDEDLIARALPSGAVAVNIEQAITHTFIHVGAEPGSLRYLASIIAAIAQELKHNAPAAAEMVEAHVNMLLIALWRLRGISAPKPSASPRLLVQRFLALVDRHLAEHWSSTQYADALGVSVDRLNSAVRRATGNSPAKYVRGRLIADAQSMLRRTGMQVVEVSENLGFADPGYFNRFFKRETGMSPGRFRRNAALRPVSRDQSFAAWP